MPSALLKSHHTVADKKIVLTKAFMRTADYLELSRQELSAIVGISESSLTRIFSAALTIDPQSNKGQLVLLLIRLYRSLDTLFGGNAKQCRAWLRHHNKHLSGVPIELIQSIEGLVLVIQYLDAMRGKN